MFLIRNLTRNRIDKKWLEKVARQTLKTTGIKGRTEISLVICDNKKIRQLNRIYRGKNKVTDVLSFGRKPTANSPRRTSLRGRQHLTANNQEPKFIEPPNKIAHLGEIFICLPEAKKQAKIYQEPLKHVLARLLIHGILHLVGYDHRGKTKKMIELEEKILSSMYVQF